MEQNIDYKKLFGDSYLPRFILEKDGSGHFAITALNESACTLFGQTEEVLTGKNLGFLFNEDSCLSFQVYLEKAGHENKAVSFPCPENLKYEGVGRFLISPIVVKKAKNKTVAEETILRFEITAVPPDENSEALQRERDDAISLLTSVFDVSEVGIVVTDRHQRIVRVNDSFVRIYGWSRDELVGHEFSNIVVPEEREFVKKSQLEFLKSGIRASGEMKILRKDNKIANALFTTASLDLSQGRQFQVTTIMDITLRKQMEFSLRQAKEDADSANQAKSTFLANMSHELRTPLNAIIGFSEMMMKETFGPLGAEKYNEYIGDVHNSACHLLEIINEVLDMSKIEAGKVELDESYFNIGDLLDSICRMMASRAFSDGLSLEADVEENIPPLYADHRLIRQILINLVGNAFKYSEQGGTVFMRAYISSRKNLRLEVEDNGVGIPKSKIKNALEPFGQVSDAQKRNRQGTGLGLPLAKAMAELHGGALRLESELNKGTKVTVSIPARRLQPGLDKKKPMVGDDEFSPFADVIKS